MDTCSKSVGTYYGGAYPKSYSVDWDMKFFERRQYLFRIIAFVRITIRNEDKKWTHISLDMAYIAQSQ
jgi:hypothetical protein